MAPTHIPRTALKAQENGDEVAAAPETLARAPATFAVHAPTPHACLSGHASPPSSVKHRCFEAEVESRGAEAWRVDGSVA